MIRPPRPIPDADRDQAGSDSDASGGARLPARRAQPGLGWEPWVTEFATSLGGDGVMIADAAQSLVQSQSSPKGISPSAFDC